ncbi:MAG: hypothetical protein V9F03_09555 [Microthrixaceae bacterium]
MSYPDRPIVIVSNRGPVTFTATREADRTVIGAKRGSGGLVSGLAPLLESGDARWVAAALGDGDRLFASIGSAESPFSPDEHRWRREGPGHRSFRCPLGPGGPGHDDPGGTLGLLRRRLQRDALVHPPRAL